MIKRITITVLILFTFFPFLKENSYSDESRGKELFEEKRCVRCHTIGRGQFVGPDLYQ
ncbi:MAG: c-type cytochrome, partial [Thermodesulfobacteriota bacterium]